SRRRTYCRKRRAIPSVLQHVTVGQAMAAALKAARVQVAGEVHQERSCVYTRQHTACWAVCGWVLTVGAGMHTVVIIVWGL
ncbi:MAG: hypothetical protein ACPIOQ_75300, partial [Promethearchaeia archaeon]